MDTFAWTSRDWTKQILLQTDERDSTAIFFFSDNVSSLSQLQASCVQRRYVNARLTDRWSAFQEDVCCAQLWPLKDGLELLVLYPGHFWPWHRLNFRNPRVIHDRSTSAAACSPVTLIEAPWFLIMCKWNLDCSNIHFSFLGAVAKMRKGTISFVMSVSPSVCLRGKTRVPLDFDKIW